MFFFHFLDYQPGTRGIKWTEYHAKVIRRKILYLWKNWEEVAKDFDYGTPSATNTDYVFDPDKKLSTKDCGNKNKGCNNYWKDKNRFSGIAFTERKAIR